MKKMIGEYKQGGPSFFIPIKHSENKSMWSVLQAMKQRCSNANSKCYKHYGGRGITVCKEWLEDYKSFIKWCLSNGWEQGLEIDRINNDGNYEPKNCRFVTRQQNNSNKRNNCIIEYNDVKKTLAAWSNEFGIDRKTLHYRIFTAKMPLHDAFTLPAYIKSGGNDGEMFTSDVMPVNQQEDEEAYLTEQEKAIAWSEFEYEMQLRERENNF